jgi:hypothetical protein
MLVGDNINMDIKEIGYNVSEWTYLSQGRGHWRTFLNMKMKNMVSQKEGNSSHISTIVTSQE